MKTLAEKRRFPRAPLPYRLEIGRGSHHETARIADISERGVRLCNAPDLPFDQDVEMTIPLRRQDGKNATCRVVGQVVRRDDKSVGVHFLPLLPADMLRLRDFVWRNSAAEVW
ncbi:MAG: PilZ domain-containing protein [Deltaproteobacteria bacterium]|nr:PilZ domain-containing protein [Deltaproteobacteria bacterium]